MINKSDFINKLSTDEKIKTVFGTIQKKIDNREYEVLTDMGDTINVTSDRVWSIGSQVVVQNNVIQFSGKRSGTFQIFEG